MEVGDYIGGSQRLLYMMDGKGWRRLIASTHKFSVTPFLSRVGPRPIKILTDFGRLDTPSLS